MKQEKKQISLSDEAKKLPLNNLKSQSGLSNKKWGKTIKELTKNGLAKVEKTDDALFVEFGLI